ncbi:MAG: hypothetical protein JST26_02795 [Bacteroidetes bacterium]|nr:hypothetical protein [Bacteroidota bacterium]
MSIRRSIQFFLKPVENTGFWIGLGLVVKLLFFLNGLREFGATAHPGFIGAYGGDTFYYLQPMEQWYKTGVYMPDFRMPGMAPLYLLFREVLSYTNAQNAVLVVQWIMASLSVFFLAKSVFLISKSRLLFYLTFYVLLLSSYANLYDYYFLPDSLATSATIFFMYFLVKYYVSRRLGNLFISGLFFCWLVFLRPPYALLPLFMGAVCILPNIKKITLSKSLATLLVFSSGFILVDSCWITRNYGKYARIIPLQKAVYYETANNDYLEPLSEFVTAFGGNMYFWDPDAEIRWFNFRKDAIHIESSRPPELPENIYTSQFNRDSLLNLKKRITEAESGKFSPEEERKINEGIGATCRRYEQSLKAERPELYYVTSRLKAAYRFVFSNGTYNLFNEPFRQLNVLKVCVRFFYEGFYKLIALLCVAGIVFFPYRLRMLIFFLPVLYTFILFPFVFRFSEYRYMVPAYPFMVVSACYLVFYYKNKWFTSSAQ